MTEMPILNIYTTSDSGNVKCNIYKKNRQEFRYLKMTEITGKTPIFNHKLYSLNSDLGKDLRASVIEVQKHPVSGRILHVDLFLIEPNDSNIRLKLPLKYIGQDRSVEIKRGAYLMKQNWIEVITDYKNLVPFISVDISEMKPGESLQKIQTPNGIRALRDDINRCTMAASKGAES